MLKKSKKSQLSKAVVLKITTEIEGQMEYLEEKLNESLKKIIDELLPNLEGDDRVETIAVAREIFFKG